MKYFHLLFFILFLLFYACESNNTNSVLSEDLSSREIKHPATNSEISQQKPYVILISVDGYRWDYTEKYKAVTLASFDVKTEKMIPSFPSKTFPNHYSLVTGLYPGNHGLVSNTFYNPATQRTYEISNREEVRDGGWYKGNPLWSLASENKMVTASMFWVGSETRINGYWVNNYFNYDSDISNQDRVDQVIKWLQYEDEIRPHFITLYFELIDDIGHDYGPDSEEISVGVQIIDSLIADLKLKVDKTQLPVNIIVVSDHGMLPINPHEMIDIGPYANENTVITTSFPVMIYSENQNHLDSSYNQLKQDDRLNVYWKDSLPDHYHFHSDEVIGDLVITPKPNYYPFLEYKTSSTASHGWDPHETPEMGAIFYANGPAFNKGLTIPPFENIHVYPLIAEILDLDYDSTTIDGSLKVLKPILRKD